jgi:hypothetical protein
VPLLRFEPIIARIQGCNVCCYTTPFNFFLKYVFGWFLYRINPSFQIQDSRSVVICWMIFHSYARKKKHIFCAQRVPPPSAVFPGWQLNRLDGVPSLDISASSSQFSQACHNYNVFDNAVVCVYFVWSSSNRESYLAVWVVSTWWSLAGCVYNGLHMAHLPLSLNCLLVCSHSCGEKNIPSTTWYCIFESVRDPEVWQ